MNKKRIMLLNPNYTVEKGSIRRVVTPFNLLYIGAVLEKEGYDVSIIDSPCEGYDNVIEKGDFVTYGLSKEQTSERIRKGNPDVVGISCSFSYLEKEVYALSKLVKSIDNKILTIVGGIHPSLLPKEMLQECKEIDFIIMKEGEYRILNLLNAINDKRDHKEQEGIAFRDNDRIKVNPPTSFIKNLDELPLPARHLINFEKIIEIGKPSNPFSKNERAEGIFTQRGCPFNCCFCANPNFLGRRVRTRGVESIISEMKLLKEKYNIQEIHFLDDNLTLNRKRAMDIFKRMKEEKLDLDWCTPGGLMIGTLDEELIEVMAESGCYQITLSPESGSQRVLDEIIHKPINLKAVKPTVDLAHKHGIRVHSNFVVGLPGETKKELLESFDFAKEAGFDSASFFVAVPYMGTELYEICKKRKWIKKDEKIADRRHASITIPEYEKEYVISKEELEKLIDTKTREFNEWNKKRNPERWENKFKRFLKEHEEDAEKIKGTAVF